MTLLHGVYVDQRDPFRDFRHLSPAGHAAYSILVYDLHDPVVRIAFGMILGGAIGNIVDRLHYQFVVDFIDFYRIWPNVFNVADSCITGGVILLILSSLAKSRRRA